MTDCNERRRGKGGKFVSTKAPDATTKSTAGTTKDSGDEKSLPEATLDGRTRGARRFRQLVRAFEADLGGGLSAADRSLVRSAAALTLRAEQCQTDLLDGKPVDDEQLVRLTHASARILNTLRQHRSKRQSSNDGQRVGWQQGGDDEEDDSGDAGQHHPGA